MCGTDLFEEQARRSDPGRALELVGQRLVDDIEGSLGTTGGSVDIFTNSQPDLVPVTPRVSCWSQNLHLIGCWVKLRLWTSN